MQVIVIALISFLTGLGLNILLNLIFSNFSKCNDNVYMVSTKKDNNIRTFHSKTFNKIFTIIGGVNGVGKSSLSGVLLNEN